MDAPVYVGRQAELAAVRACADDALAGRSRVVWIEGPAGAGKTALLDRALELLPGGFAITRAEADELAGDVPFGVVGQLADLPSGASSFAAGLELVARWSAEQDARPVAVAVEDLHWADLRSREALLTAARRLGRDRVVLIVTSRPDGTADGWERLRLDPRRCRCIEVAPLSVDEVADLACATGVPLPRWAAERLHRHTAGHALHVRTLLGELDAEQLTRTDGDLPAPRTLASTTVSRLAALPSEARELALALAVVGRAVPLTVAARVAGLTAPTTALDQLLTTGFATWRSGPTGPVVGFAHPLYRAALYDDLAPVRRQRLHRAAAEALGATEGLAHRVAAADGVDPPLADDLVAAAAREPAPGVAARYLLWASAVAPNPAQAERHLLEGVWRMLADGQLIRAAELRDRVEGCADAPLRDLVLGTLDWEAGRTEPAETALRRAADEGGPQVAAGALGTLGYVCFTLGRGAEAVEAATRLLALPDLPADAERDGWISTALGEMSVRGAPAGLDRLTTRLPQAPELVPPGDADLLVVRGTLGFYAGRATAAVADLRAGIRLARRRGTAQTLPRAHLQLAQLLVSTGEYDDALLHARVARSLVEDERLVWIDAQAHAVLGRLHACRGAWAEAEHHVAAAQAVAATLGTSEAVFTACIAEATLARARARPADVIAAFAPVLGDGRPLPMATSLGWWPMAVFATLDAGDVASAHDQVDRLRAAAEERGIDLTALVTGLAALVVLAEGDPGSAAEGLARATALAGADVPVLDRAELHHRWGRLLLGRGQRRDGVAQLRRAAELLTGAEPFLGRVEADLATAGMHAPRRGRRSPLDLTARERDVVALVVRGMTNHEAAGELYVSDKAVEYHLGNVYAKLGIRSRRELRARLGSEN